MELKKYLDYQIKEGLKVLASNKLYTKKMVCDVKLIAAYIFFPISFKYMSKLFI